MNHIQAGKIVSYYWQNELCYALVLDSDRDSAQIRDAQGMVHRFPQKRFIQVSQTCYALDAPQLLNAFMHKVQDALQTLDVDFISKPQNWHAQPLSIEELCRAWQMPADETAFALYALMRSMPGVFSHKHNLFRLLNSEEQSQFSQKEHERIREARFANLLQEFCAKLATGHSFPNTDDFTELLKYRLRRHLIYGEYPDLAKQIRTAFGTDTFENAIIKIRLALSEIDDNTDPLIALSGIPVLHQIEPILPMDMVNQEDLTKLLVFSIDDADTHDIDDAISWESSPEGYTLGIHIADISSRIPKDSLLFADAIERCSSLYFADCNIDMFHPKLIAESFSLSADRESLALSLLLDIDAGFNVISYRFVQSRIKVNKNYSYRDIDAKRRDEPFASIHSFCQKLLKERSGDYSSTRFAYYPQIKAGKLTLKKIDNHSFARTLVSELMILYNRCFAEQTQKLQVPAIYRNIEQFFSDSEDSESEVIGSTAFLSTTASYHPGIGSEAYIHATSPIRRVADLINQHGFCAILQGKNPQISLEELQSYIPHIEKRLLLHRELYTILNRKWFLRYLIQEHCGEPLEAKLLRRNKNGALIELLKWNKKLQISTDLDKRQTENFILIPLSIDEKSDILIADVIA